MSKERSYKEIRLSLLRHLTEYEGLTEEKRNSGFGKRLQAKIKVNVEKIKKIENSLGRTYGPGGNYKCAL